MAFAVKDWRNATTSTGGGDESTPLTAAALEDLETRLSNYSNAASIYFNVQTYGAVGDGSTDDWAAIMDARTAAQLVGGTVYFPTTADNRYAVSQALPFDVNYVGESVDVTIVALSGLASESVPAIFDMNPQDATGTGPGYTLWRRMAHLSLDANLVSGVACMGADNHIGNGGQLFDQIQCLNSAPGQYACGTTGASPDANNGVGIFVGSTWRNCAFFGCAQWIDLRNTNDDILFMGLRGAMDNSNKPTTGAPIRIGGQNIRFQTSWFQIGESNYTGPGGIKALVENAGQFVVKFENTYVEAVTGNDSDLTHIIQNWTLNARLTVEGFMTGIQDAIAPDLRGLFWGYLTDDTFADFDLNPRLKVDNVTMFTFDGYDAAQPAIFELLVATGAAAVPFRNIQLEFAGCDDFTNLLIFDSTSENTADQNTVILRGQFQGKSYDHSTCRFGWESPVSGWGALSGLATNRILAPTAVDSRAGMRYAESRSTSASGASPRSSSAHVLAGTGHHLVTVSALLGGVPHISVSGLWFVSLWTDTTVIEVIDQLGTNHIATGSGFTDLDIAFNGSHQIVATAAFGGSGAVTFLISSHRAGVIFPGS